MNVKQVLVILQKKKRPKYSYRHDVSGGTTWHAWLLDKYQSLFLAPQSMQRQRDLPSQSRRPSHPVPMDQVRQNTISAV